MARAKSLPRKTVHPNKLFRKNYKPSISEENKENKDGLYNSTLSILIFMFFFIKYEVYKFENIKSLFMKYVFPYCEHLNFMDIYSICMITVLIYPNYVFKLLDKLVVLGLKSILVIEFILCFFGLIKN